jgi:hypothetical protein
MCHRWQGCAVARRLGLLCRGEAGATAPHAHLLKRLRSPGCRRHVEAGTVGLGVVADLEGAWQPASGPVDGQQHSECPACAGTLPVLAALARSCALMSRQAPGAIRRARTLVLSSHGTIAHTVPSLGAPPMHAAAARSGCGWPRASSMTRFMCSPIAACPLFGCHGEAMRAPTLDVICCEHLSRAPSYTVLLVSRTVPVGESEGVAPVLGG